MPEFELMKKFRTRPDGRPALYQKWMNLLFLHWKFEIEEVQKTLPEGLFVDSYDDAAWVAIVPFFMRDIHPWWFPSVPCISNFLEVNLRTYVVDENGIPGVWFYSLAANQFIAVEWGRRVFHLPYFNAGIKANVSNDGQTFDYSLTRSGTENDFQSRFCWKREGECDIAQEETFEFFLFERYLMYNQTGPKKFRIGQVWHTPYQFQPVELFEFDDQMLILANLEQTGREPDHVAFSPGVETEVFPLLDIQKFNP